ncbi:hypothetical protein XELAEV_18029967mg [Xenopus laevis]|uniref:Uncharacterized protein n=1 Tax=Xenopus laevis TaxID=8355 RepID=A0A974CSV0_XENLA|nr:hypothetical protein XELAEV_18029967mg [Xenopus laevis]
MATFSQGSFRTLCCTEIIPPLSHRFFEMEWVVGGGCITRTEHNWALCTRRVKITTFITNITIFTLTAGSFSTPLMAAVSLPIDHFYDVLPAGIKSTAEIWYHWHLLQCTDTHSFHLSLHIQGDLMLKTTLFTPAGNAP